MPTPAMNESHIEGRFLMPDDTTPHIAVVAQLVDARADDSSEPAVAATTLSNEAGKYRFTHLKSGRYRLRCYTLNGWLYYQNGAVLQVERGTSLEHVDFRFPAFKKGIWRNYHFFDGLAPGWVSAIYQTPDDALWFGTSSGVSRYDGREFVRFTVHDGLAHHDVLAICCDDNGVMWFGTAGGLSRYDGRRFTTLTTEDGLPGNSIRAICRDREGTLWFGTNGGVSRYAHPRSLLTKGRSKRGFINLTTNDGLADNTVNAIYQTSDGTMWFGTQGGLSRYDPHHSSLTKGRSKGGFVNFTSNSGEFGDDRLPTNHVTAICEDSTGSLWLGLHEHGLCRYDGQRFVALTPQDGLVHGEASSICCPPDGTVWCGTGVGISRYDGVGFVNFTEADGLSHNWVRSVHLAADGAIWCGTAAGLSRYTTAGECTRFTIKDGLVSDLVNACYRGPDGVMWLGTSDGVSRYDGVEFVDFTTEDGLAHPQVWTIHGDTDGAIWCGHGMVGGGVSRYDGERFVPFTTADGLADNRVEIIFCDADGAMWLGTAGGLCRYDEGGFTTVTPDDGAPEHTVCAIHQAADGVMWFGTWGDGVSRYDGREFVTLTTEDGLPSNDVWAIYSDPVDRGGALWFGTCGGGVSRYDGREFVTFTTKHGLASNAIWNIYRDARGILWFGTTAGVSCYDGIAWSSLDARDGLPGNELVRLIGQDEDGTLWFGGHGGVTRYRPGAAKPGVRIFRVTTDESYTKLDAIPPVTVGARVTVEYGALDFKTIPAKQQYRVRVREIDTDWRCPTKATTFEYRFEKTGVYTVEVQAIDRDLNDSEPAAVSLTVQPDPQLVALQTEVVHLRREMKRKYQFENLIGCSDAMNRVRLLMERAVDSPDMSVLITGETGTGKELVAKGIHYSSARGNKTPVTRDCGTISHELAASELFGHRKGAFTGADRDKVGLFEAAHGSTLILDEIGNMAMEVQSNLLRALEERKVTRVGETVERPVEVRIIAITNRDLQKEVQAGRFREDLYYRLSVFPIHVPPLRERQEDIPLLAEYFLREIDKEIDGFAPGVLEMLQSYHWPGNVRDLKNAIRFAAASVEEGMRLETTHFPVHITQGESLMQEMLAGVGGKHSRYRELVNEFERRCIERALKACNGNRTQAAKMLGIERKYFYEKIGRLKIDVPPNKPNR